MNPRLTTVGVTVFAVLLLGAGAALTFLPEEIGAAVSGSSTPPIVLAVLGAALFGLGLLNWTARQAPIGGIYGRPVLLANLVHFTVGGLALLRVALAEPVGVGFWGVTLVYLAGLVFYGVLLFRGPADPLSTGASHK
ncbi:MAG: hypothetical protein HKN04_15510 [Rhodothermaceae bacterium]|nr:hypothetical protein [Rhodothermaceae bacterium]